MYNVYRSETWSCSSVVQCYICYLGAQVQLSACSSTLIKCLKGNWLKYRLGCSIPSYNMTQELDVKCSETISNLIEEG